ncbi:zinc carboxypeptidase A 1-like [Procambarus clarkii]|uniref:zinc carboxypeptidase A 1-like n=1 Tax=Procambarus clarkii TaxID=6728 RepID=UPI003743EAA4
MDFFIQRLTLAALWETTAEHPMDWNVDHNTEGVEKFLNWVKEMGGCFVQVLTAATTEEGRQVLVIKVTVSDEPKTKIWIETGIHAREWISPAVSMYILNLLITDESWRDLLKRTEWYIVPVVNPDGYHYTFTSESASETYKGVTPFTEPETQGLQAIMETVGGIDLFIAFRGYGQCIVYPVLRNDIPPANIHEHEVLAMVFAHAMSYTSRGHMKYEMGE